MHVSSLLRDTGSVSALAQTTVTLISWPQNTVHSAL